MSYTEGSYDYEPENTPRSLARESEAVVLGTIVDVREGQSYAPSPDEDAAITTSVIELDISRVFKGRSVVANGSVYVEIPHPAFVGRGYDGSPRDPFDHDGFSKTVPRARRIFFLDDRTNEPFWPTILNQGRGRPEGAPLTAAMVQGFLFEDDERVLHSANVALENMPPAWQELRSIEDEVDAI